MIRRDFASAEAIPPATSIILYIRKNYRHKANPLARISANDTPTGR